jgi:L-lactate utilization protein LutC
MLTTSDDGRCMLPWANSVRDRRRASPSTADSCDRGVALAESLVEAFVREAERSDASVHRDADWDALEALARRLAEGGRIVVAPSAGIPADVLARLGGGAAVTEDERAVDTAADAAVGVVRARAGVAETGSVLLVEESMADRAVSMLARTLVVIIEGGDVVADLMALRPHLAPAGGQPPHYAALVTGPSRTADIERSLTIGVQGPAAVHLVLWS